jgi:hypothetical protein
MALSPAEHARAEVLALAHPAAILAAALVVRLRAEGDRELAARVAAAIDQRKDRSGPAEPEPSG